MAEKSFDIDDPRLNYICDFNKHLSVRGTQENFGGVGNFGTEFVCGNCKVKFSVNNKFLNDQDYLEERFSFTHFQGGLPTTSDKSKFIVIEDPCEACKTTKKDKTIPSKLLMTDMGICSKCAEAGAEPVDFVLAVKDLDYPKEILDSVKVYYNNNYITMKEFIDG